MKRVAATVWLVLAMTVWCRAETASPQGRIDELAFARQAKDGFSPSGLCSDAVFVRRVYLDVIGTLPTTDEVRKFLNSRNPDKRAALIDELLQRPEFADYWALKWCDILRVKAEFPSNLWPNAVQAYHHWIRDAFRNNLPYDQFARALLTASGSNFRDPPVNFYRPFQERTPRRIFETVALVFMCMRLENAHLTEDQILGMDAFFAKVAYKKTDEWKEEIVYSDPNGKLLHPETKQPVVPVPLGGNPLKLGAFDDPRFAFADWLTAKNNPWFAKAAVNRVWCWLLGRGIVSEVDDIRPDNPPWSPELLAYLEKELTENKYDLKHIYRLILNSATYQLSSVPTPENVKDVNGFSHYQVRRLDAEVLIDAICQITGTTEEYSSAIPEPFTFIPENQRSIELADGSVKSSFLELFGRPGRDTSYASERNNGVSTYQALHLLNSSHIQDKISRGPRIQQLIKAIPDSAARIDELYLLILSRLPAAEEKQIAMDYFKSGKNSTDASIDLVWALMNTKEFMLKH